MTDIGKEVLGSINRLNETYRLAHGLGSSTRGNPVLVAGVRRDANRSEAEARHKVRKQLCAANYTFRPKLEHGLFFGPEIDVEVHASVQCDDGVPLVCVDAVWIDVWKQEALERAEECGAVDCLRSDNPLLKAIGEAVKRQVEADEAFCEAEIDRAGFVYGGFGWNDPDGKWHRSSFGRGD